jgi:hypothetical protein
MFKMGSGKNVKQSQVHKLRNCIAVWFSPETNFLGKSVEFSR